MKSTPGMSLLGNKIPASIMIMSSFNSTTIILRPISPRPPRGIIRILEKFDN